MRSRALIRFVRRLHRPGIVYCTTTREVDSVYLVMRQLDIPAHRYHGKMTAAERAARAGDVHEVGHAGP